MARRRGLTLAVAGLIVAGAAVLAAVAHLFLGLLTFSLAVATSNADGKRAASALVQVFAADHPRVRVRTVPVPDLVAAGEALDTGATDLAIVRSDAAGQAAQTLVILRRDVVMFIAPGGSTVGSVRALQGRTVGLLNGRPLDATLLDLILAHAAIPPAEVRRRMVPLEGLTDLLRRREVDVLFVVAPAESTIWPSLLTTLRKEGQGSPKTFEVDEAAAIAKEHPLLETLDVPKGTFQGLLPSPSDDITTLSVSYRLAARTAMPDWQAGEITREVLASKQKLAALDDDLSGIEAPDTDDKTQALPIHSGSVAYLTGNLPSLSDQIQNAGYWLSMMSSVAVSLCAVGAALYNRVRPRRPPTRVMRLLEIWLELRSAAAETIDALETEADALAVEAIRAEAHGRVESPEMRLVTLLVSHVREAAQRRRTPMHMRHTEPAA